MIKLRTIPLILLPVVIGIVFLPASCEVSDGSHRYTGLREQVLLEDSTSIRTLEVMPGVLAFAGSAGVFGTLALDGDHIRMGRQAFGGTYPEFRATAHTPEDFFMLSAGNPALLYKTGDAGRMELVYQERGPGVFYDAMEFWDSENGLAFGDSEAGCFAVLITRDGGLNWDKVACGDLPAALPGEGAFAASDTNIAMVGEACWIATSKGRILYSPDKGASWQVIQTPIQPESETEGLYSLDFWDASTGYAIGGDYTRPDRQQGNKLRTRDGGMHWERVADGSPPGYKSCVQYVPGSGGQDLVAVGFTGISYSTDGGDTWKTLSESPYFSIRFVDDSVAYASGRGRLSKLVFERK